MESKKSAYYRKKLFSIYSVAFGALRFFLEGDHWGFLLYNLWLGWIPLLIAAVVAWRGWSGWKLGLCGIVWLIFLPNAPYIVTDFIQLRLKSTLTWFDLILIFNYAVAGLLAGSLSIDWMKNAAEKSPGRIPSYLLTGILSITKSLVYGATFAVFYLVFCGLGKGRNDSRAKWVDDPRD